VSFDFEKIWEYCAQEAHKATYILLNFVDQAAVRASAKERFISFALIKTSNSKHDKIKDDLSDDYTKGSVSYPQNRSQVLMLMNLYSKAPTAITASEGTAFVQKGGKKKKGDKDEAKSDTPKYLKDFNKEWWKDKECYRCGKKGHPASECSVKPPSDDDDKSSRSSKSSSEVMAEIQKSMKTMGKAMTQLGEGADFDDDLFEEQSHAQVSAYLYATRKTMSMRDQLLLDNQSSVHMCNPKFVTNIRSSEGPMVLKSNGGTLPINKVADFEGFEIETWFSGNAMTNILSFLLVKSEYDITYDGNAFIIHRAAKGFPDMVFKPHASRLHVYDPEDTSGLASYSFMETVESNMALFTKQQIHSVNANLAWHSHPTQT